MLGTLHSLTIPLLTSADYADRRLGPLVGNVQLPGLRVGEGNPIAHCIAIRKRRTVNALCPLARDQRGTAGSARCHDRRPADTGS